MLDVGSRGRSVEHAECGSGGEECGGIAELDY